MSCSCGNSSFNNIKGDPGVGISDITAAIVGSNIVFTVTYTDGNTTTTSVPKPANGDPGDQGLFGGFSSSWKFLDTTSGVTTNYLNFNSVTPSSVTTIKVHDTNIDGTNLDPFLDYLGTGNFGLIKLFKADNSGIFWMGKITAVVDSGSYHTLTVEYITSNSLFALDDEVVLGFTPIGLPAPTDTCSNVGSEVEIYKTGTDTPFEFKTIYSSDNTVQFTEETDKVDITIDYGSYRTINAVGSGASTTLPVYQVPGSGFTSITDATGHHPVAMKKDLSTDKVIMKGAAVLTGAGTIGFSPTGSYNTSILTICTLPTLLSPSVTTVLSTAQLYNSTIKHASTVLVSVSSGVLYIIVDHRLNYVDANTIISFENTMFSL